MTNYNERLDRVLSDYAEAIGSYVNFGSPFNSDEDNIAGAEALYQTSYNEAKQAITSLIKELVAEAEADIKLWVDDEVIGSDERHSNGKKMVNYWSCEDCGTPEEAWTRNQLRADQRKRLWLEKFEQNLLKALEEK